MAASWSVIVRDGPRVSREKPADRDAALDTLERRGRELELGADARAVGGTLMRRIEPVQQVVGRIELRGPGVRAGVDVRGDGSAEAFTGRVRRHVVEQRTGESAYDALRRELSA